VARPIIKLFTGLTSLRKAAVLPNFVNIRVMNVF